MKEIQSDIEYDELFEDIEIIPVYSSTEYTELFSDIEIFVGVIPVGGVWEWFSGIVVQWESGANVELE